MVRIVALDEAGRVSARNVAIAAVRFGPRGSCKALVSETRLRLGAGAGGGDVRTQLRSQGRRLRGHRPTTAHRESGGLADCWCSSAARARRAGFTLLAMPGFAAVSPRRGDKRDEDHRRQACVRAGLRSSDSCRPLARNAGVGIDGSTRVRKPALYGRPDQTGAASGVPRALTVISPRQNSSVSSSAAADVEIIVALRRLHERFEAEFKSSIDGIDAWVRHNNADASVIARLERDPGGR